MVVFVTVIHSLFLLTQRGPVPFPLPGVKGSPAHIICTLHCLLHLALKMVAAGSCYMSVTQPTGTWYENPTTI